MMTASGRAEFSAANSCRMLALCLFVVAAAGCLDTIPDRDSLGDATSDQSPYKLGSGDKLRVVVYLHEDLSGTFVVDDAGRISLPLIRGINVEGLTLPEIEQTITRRLIDNHIADPKVSVDLSELRPFCVLGEVRNPGCFSYVHGMTASKAIATAGGYSYRARKDDFVLTRKDGRKVAADQDTPIFSGDMLEVFDRLF